MDRSHRIKHQKGRGIVRALHESELANAGAERADALRRAEYQLERIARLLPDALDAGLGMTEIAQLTGVSRPTLYELRARYGDSPRDLRLAVMQALTRHETSFPDALPRHLARSADEIHPIIDEFFERGWIEWDVEGAEPRQAPEEGGLPFAAMNPQAPWAQETPVADDEMVQFPYGVTMAGYEALEQWKFEDEAEGNDGAAIG
jgi:DNA-binding phage protein